MGFVSENVTESEITCDKISVSETVAGGHHKSLCDDEQASPDGAVQASPSSGGFAALGGAGFAAPGGAGPLGGNGSSGPSGGDGSSSLTCASHWKPGFCPAPLSSICNGG
ncbi:UNVERIFIED_CONTAM: hypothetical protein FKN15_014800 [Acipenser sinensis]